MEDDWEKRIGQQLAEVSAKRDPRQIEWDDSMRALGLSSEQMRDYRFARYDLSNDVRREISLVENSTLVMATLEAQFPKLRDLYDHLLKKVA